MSKLLCAALLTLAIGCKDKAADAPKPSEPTAAQPSDPSPAARKAEAPKLPDEVKPTAGSGSAEVKAEGKPVESKDPTMMERHKGGITRGAFPVNQAFEQMKKKKPGQR